MQLVKPNVKPVKPNGLCLCINHTMTNLTSCYKTLLIVWPSIMALRLLHVSISLELQQISDIVYIM